jgi:hypothetical protein
VESFESVLLWLRNSALDNPELPMKSKDQSPGEREAIFPFPYIEALFA